MNHWRFCAHLMLLLTKKRYSCRNLGARKAVPLWSSAWRSTARGPEHNLSCQEVSSQKRQRWHLVRPEALHAKNRMMGQEDPVKGRFAGRFPAWLTARLARRSGRTGSEALMSSRTDTGRGVADPSNLRQACHRKANAIS